MEKRSITCVVCPVGCNIEITMDGCKICGMSGNSCARGEAYARTECINPVRTITSTVRFADGINEMVPVKSDKPIPKSMMGECMRQINKCRVDHPVKIGEVIIGNILGTGADIVATGNVEYGSMEN